MAMWHDDGSSVAASSAVGSRPAGVPTPRRSGSVFGESSAAGSRSVPPGGASSINLKWEVQPTPAYSRGNLSARLSHSCSEARWQGEGNMTPRSGRPPPGGNATVSLVWEDARTVPQPRGKSCGPASSVGESVLAQERLRGHFAARGSNAPSEGGRHGNDEERPPTGRASEAGGSRAAGRASEVPTGSRSADKFSEAELRKWGRGQQGTNDFKPPSRVGGEPEPPSVNGGSVSGAERAFAQLGGAGQAKNAKLVEATRYYNQDPTAVRLGKQKVSSGVPSADWFVTETNRYFLDRHAKGRARPGLQSQYQEQFLGQTVRKEAATQSVGGGRPNSAAKGGGSQAGGGGSVTASGAQPRGQAAGGPREGCGGRDMCRDEPPANAPLLSRRGGKGTLASQSTCDNTRAAPDFQRLDARSCAGAPSEADSLPLGVEWSTYIAPSRLVR